MCKQPTKVIWKTNSLGRSPHVHSTPKKTEECRAGLGRGLWHKQGLCEWTGRRKDVLLMDSGWGQAGKQVPEGIHARRARRVER